MENKFHQANNNKIPIIEANDNKIPMIGNQIEFVSFTHHSILMTRFHIILTSTNFLRQRPTYTANPFPVLITGISLCSNSTL